MYFKKPYLICSIAFITLFLIQTILLVCVDVSQIGPQQSSVGVSFINSISSGIEYKKGFDILADVFLVLAVGLVIVFAVLGIIQLAKNKSLSKVDFSIILSGILLVVFGIFWVVFDKVFIVNYRPILVDGQLEASYPSTHIMLVTFVLLSSAFLGSKYITIKGLQISFYAVASVCIALSFIARLMSGMHWLTDCTAALFLGLFLFFALLAINKKPKQTEV